MTRLDAGQTLVVASHNPGKVWEITRLIQPYGLEARSAKDLNLPEPEETAATFVGNAELKALAAAKASGLPALADDSGLEVDLLDGAPGIYSARWAGPGKDFQLAMQKVADELRERGGWNTQDTAPTKPAANFICVLCLAWPDGKTETFEGRVDGHLVWPPRGGNGFGYDPMFVADGMSQTFGEIEPQAKHALSHRRRAFDLFERQCLGPANKKATAPADGDVIAGLTAAAASLSTRAEFVRFVKNLQASQEADEATLQNLSASAYLAAIEDWANDAPIGEQEPVWRVLAKALLAPTRRNDE